MLFSALRCATPRTVPRTQLCRFSEEAAAPSTGVGAQELGAIADSRRVLALLDKQANPAVAAGVWKDVWTGLKEQVQNAYDAEPAVKSGLVADLTALEASAPPAELAVKIARINGLRELLSSSSPATVRADVPDGFDPRGFSYITSPFEAAYSRLLSDVRTSNTMDLLQRDDDIATLRLKALGLLRTSPTLAAAWRTAKKSGAALSGDAAVLNDVLELLAVKRANKEKMLSQLTEDVAAQSGQSSAAYVSSLDRELESSNPLLFVAPASQNAFVGELRTAIEIIEEDVAAAEAPADALSAVELPAVPAAPKLSASAPAAVESSDKTILAKFDSIVASASR